MTTRELINILERYDGNTEVVINGENSGGYVSTTYNVRVGTVRSMFGKDFQAVIIDGDQVGMVD